MFILQWKRKVVTFNIALPIVISPFKINKVNLKKNDFIPGKAGEWLRLEHCVNFGETI